MIPLPTLSTAKLISLAVAIVAFAAFVLLAFHWKDTMTARGKQLGTICAATRAAADNPKLDCALVAQQIGEFGKSIDTLNTALASQNAKVAAMGQASADQQAAASEAIKTATGRAQTAEATSERLAASSRAGEAQAKPCVPSKALEEAWK